MHLKKRNYLYSFKHTEIILIEPQKQTFRRTVRLWLDHLKPRKDASMLKQSDQPITLSHERTYRGHQECATEIVEIVAQVLCHSI